MLRSRRPALLGNSRHVATAAGAAALALVISGCEGVVFISTLPGAPSPNQIVIVSVNIAQTQAVLQGFAVSGNSSCDANVDIIVTASQTVDLDSVTIHLMDGANSDGPTITFPESQLAEEFETRRVTAGTTRTFRLQPRFACGTNPRSMVTDTSFVDLAGVFHNVTTTTPWP